MDNVLTLALMETFMATYSSSIYTYRACATDIFCPRKQSVPALIYYNNDIGIIYYILHHNNCTYIHHPSVQKRFASVNVRQ